MRIEMKVVCSSRDTSVGVGSLMVLTVDKTQPWLSVDEDGETVTDVDGVEYKVYDVLSLEVLNNR